MLKKETKVGNCHGRICKMLIVRDSCTLWSYELIGEIFF